MMEMIERVAEAIDAVQLWSRFNDWTSDRVPGLPIEICRYGDEGEDEIVVVERFGGAITEAEALADTVSKARARAAIEAMREPMPASLTAAFDVTAATEEWYDHDPDAAEPQLTGAGAGMIWRAMIDAALKP